MDTDSILLLAPIGALSRVCCFQAAHLVNMKRMAFAVDTHLNAVSRNTYSLTSLAWYVWLFLAAFLIGVLEAAAILVVSFVFMFGIAGPILRNLSLSQKHWLGLVSLFAVWPLTIALYLVLWLR